MNRNSQNAYCLLLATLCIVFAFNSCNLESNLPPVTETSIFETLSDNPELSDLSAAIFRAGFDSVLTEDGPFTLFAPTNASFSAVLQTLGYSSIDLIPLDELQDLLRYHLIPGRRLTNSFTNEEVPTFLQDRSLKVQVSSGQITLNDQTNITQSNLEATNGIIHIIDAVLLPPSNTIVDVATANGLTVFLQAVTEAGLLDELTLEGPFTVFAPTNEAFGRFLTDQDMTQEDFMSAPDLADRLLYHIAPGSTTATTLEPGSLTSLEGHPFYISEAPNGSRWINGNTRITAFDRLADNGVVHVINYMITAPKNDLLTEIMSSGTAEAPEFTQLLAALERAELTETFSDPENNLTVFAPTDEAFQTWYGTLGVNSVSEIPLETLTDMLLYHLLPVRRFFQDFREGGQLPTLREEGILTVNLAESKINEAGMIEDLLNIHASNGVIHGIESVLVP